MKPYDAFNKLMKALNKEEEENMKRTLPNLWHYGEGFFDQNLGQNDIHCLVSTLLESKCVLDEGATESTL